MNTITGNADPKYNNYYPVTGLTSKVYNDYLDHFTRYENPKFRETVAKKQQTAHKSETCSSEQWKSDSETPVKQPEKVKTTKASTKPTKPTKSTKSNVSTESKKDTKETFANNKCRSNGAMIIDLAKVNLVPIILLILIIMYLK